jgi:hypothetical protein
MELAGLCAFGEHQRPTRVHIVTVEVGAGGPKVLGWRVGRYWVLDDGLRDTRGDGGQIAREDVLLPETESDRIQKVA